MKINLFGKIFQKTLLFIFLFEIISCLGHFLPIFNTIGFFAVLVFTIILSIYKFEYGFYVLICELFIGSLGRLFSINIFGFSLSIRIALWALIMTLWSIRFFYLWYKTRNFPLMHVIKSRYIKFFILLFIFIIWGIVNALLNKNGLGNIFNDFNAWIFFSLIFPSLDIFQTKEESVNYFLQILTASSLWISIKTFLVVYIFSHQMTFTMTEIYTWIRDTRIGEITNMESGMVRVFFQSHIFVAITSILILFLLTDLIIKKSNLKENKKLITQYFLFLSLLSAVNILGLSRSNWAGIIVGIICFFFVIIYFYGFKKIIFPLVLIIFSIGIGFSMIFGTIYFPYPQANNNFDAGSAITDRATKISGEAGASSRFSLLPELWESIKENPILGKGFGATVTYKSSDPRILEKDPTGMYTTFSFEWGWLDIWLKIGLLGVLIYLYFLFLFIFGNFISYAKNKKDFPIIEISLLLGLIIICCIHFFSPYMNHPLGIGYFILIVSIFEARKNAKISTT